MAESKSKCGANGNGINSVRNLEDLIRLNISTLEGIVNEDMDHKKAALIFTGSRTITGALKLGLEAMKLGMKQVGGVDMNKGLKKLPD
jgi:hypothetical protein